VEGLNNKAKVIMRKSYGFRTYRVLELALYHSLGKLPKPESAHDFLLTNLLEGPAALFLYHFLVGPFHSEASIGASIGRGFAYTSISTHHQKLAPSSPVSITLLTFLRVGPFAPREACGF